MSGRRIFIDVGGFVGHSVLAGLDPIFGFDRVYSFEPVRTLAQGIAKIADPRLVVVTACLSKGGGTAKIYNPGTLAGSVFADAPEYGGAAPPEVVQKLDAAAFLSAFTDPDDAVWMKLNCEGSEVDILESLLDAGETRALKGLLVDFDALKIPSQRERVAPMIERLREAGVPYMTPEQCQYGMVTNYGGVRNWLLLAGARLEGRQAASLAYNARLLGRSDVNGYHKMRILKAAPFLRPLARSHRSGASDGE
jgi:FkbM family methyltransferase